MPLLRNYEIKVPVGYLPFVPNHHLLPRSEISGFFYTQKWEFDSTRWNLGEDWTLWVETRIFDRLPVFLLFNSIEYIRIYVHMYSLLIVVEYGSEYDHQWLDIINHYKYINMFMLGISYYSTFCFCFDSRMGNF